MSRPLEAILIGAGYRAAQVYGAYALTHPEQLRFVAVAEPVDIRRARFAQAHCIAKEYQFRTWTDPLSKGQFADAVLICTPDQVHVAPAITALENGYHVLLEKPMATSLADCVRLIQTAEHTGRLLLIGHVMRHTAFFSRLYDIVKSGRLGEVITVEHRENVAYWHMAHSFVRGNWRSNRFGSPMILSKCCHDLDILYWLLGRCTKLSSFGSRTHYRSENAPPQAPERCTDGCPEHTDCPWYAPRLYLDMVPLLHIARGSPDALQRIGAVLTLDHPTLAQTARHWIPALDKALDYRGWPLSVISEDTDRDARKEALVTGPYGRCVYHCDNDVVDQQVVAMQFENGTTAVLVMHGHSHRQSRTMRYDGTRATLRGQYTLYHNEIEIHDHLTGKVETIRPTLDAARTDKDVSGDAKLIAAFIRAVHDPACAVTTAAESLESHLMAFAAEEARVHSRVVDVSALRRKEEGM